MLQPPETWQPLAPTEGGLSPHLHAIHGHRGEIVGILLIPAETQQRMVLRVLINDGAVFQMTEIEHPHWAICTHWSKHISPTTGTAEGYVIHLLGNGAEKNTTLAFVSTLPPRHSEMELTHGEQV